ncbi:MAG: hypothetical protein ACFFEN_08455 [Candidatus Thorarchaeota archaeon]
MEITPEKIYKEYINNNLDKKAAAKLFISLIENSDSVKIRAECIRELDRIGIRDETTFKFLENLFLSDSNEVIRNSAAITLSSNYLGKIYTPMKWALIHEESPSCLKTIYITLVKILQNLVISSDPLSKSFLIAEINNIKRKEFKIGFDILKETREIDSFMIEDFKDILVNYFTIIYLEKLFWRLKYKIQDCKVLELDFIFKGITCLPEALGNLTHLKTLILRYNQLTQLPEWLGELKHLETLNINVNNLNELPVSIGELSSLKNLFLWKNELSQLPDTLANLSNLEILNLRLNQIQSLPERIEHLSSLKELNLHDNQLTELPESLTRFKSLEKLILSWNQIRLLPKSLGMIPSLRVLNLERNELNKIPQNIGSLISLEYLNLSDNKLSQIPESIGNLRSLQYLNLSRNNLNSIPKSIKSLISLKELYLGENGIKIVPNSLNNLVKNGLEIHF